MTGKISADPDKVVDGSEKTAATAAGSNYGILITSIATFLAAQVKTLTNKTIDAASNTISNLSTAMFAASVVDTDTALAANSDTRLASQKAVKAYADTKAPIANATFTGTTTLAGDPVSALQAATKQYVDAVAQGLDAKPSVKAATTANVVGSGAQTIDGVALLAGDRLLVKNQSAPANNGIYVVAPGAWSRAADADAWAELPGAYVWVEQGTVNADTGWVCTVDQGGTLGTTSVTFTQFAGAGSYSAGTGLSLTGTQFAISDAELLALAGVTSAADKVFYFTGLGTGALADFTTFGRSVAAAASAAVGTALLNAVVGDSGSGGTKGLVPAPAAGDASAGKFLGADGTFKVPATGGVNRNYLINPTGLIAQEGVGSRADVTYDFDQWLTLTQSNPVTVSQVADAESGTPFMMRSLQANASPQRFGRIQWLEKNDCRELRAQAVTLSARVRSSASTTLRYAIIEWTGAADTITKDIVNDWTNGTFTAGNCFTSTSTVVAGTGSIALTANTLTDIMALTATVSAAMNNLAVFFWTDSVQAQNVTLDIGKAKLERASAATAFVQDSTQDVLNRCKRFWEKSYDYATAVGTSSQLGGLVTQLYPSNTVPNNADMPIVNFQAKRTVPAIKIYSYLGTADQIATAGGVNMGVNSGIPAIVGEGSFCNRNQSGGSLTLTTNTIFFHWTANARL